MFSKEYYEWLDSNITETKKVRDEKFLPLTNTQHRFVEWLLEENIAKTIMQIGNLKDLFVSVRNHLKNGGTYKKRKVNIVKIKNE